MRNVLSANEKITQPVLRVRGIIAGALVGLKFGRVIKDFDAIGEKKNAS
jgi:hypothetical protein